jgi:hypothetical protein
MPAARRAASRSVSSMKRDNRMETGPTQACSEHPVYTVATLVTDRGLYAEMRASFVAAGFTPPGCEYLCVDNSGPPQTSAFEGLNRLLDAARGRYVVLCHQDVRLLEHGRARLDSLLAELEAKDPAWALAGNAGGVRPGRLALRITDPHGPDRRVGSLPERVMSLDENFIVVKRAARVGFSRDLAGFHLYGADICLVADILGYTAYVIDFHLEHLSGGTKSPAFRDAERAFVAKWNRALRPRCIQTTCTLLAVSGGRLAHLLGTVSVPMAKLSRRLPLARGWGRMAAGSKQPRG